jgi:hypothetical protein
VAIQSPSHEFKRTTIILIEVIKQVY